jgi:hypothetical protein
LLEAQVLPCYIQVICKIWDTKEGNTTVFLLFLPLFDFTVYILHASLWVKFSLQCGRNASFQNVTESPGCLSQIPPVKPAAWFCEPLKAVGL